MRTRSQRRALAEQNANNDNNADNANVDDINENIPDINEEKGDEVVQQGNNAQFAQNAMRQLLELQNNVNANLINLMNGIAGSVNDIRNNNNNNNNNNVNHADINKNKYKINASFSGKESVSKFINMVKIHQQRFNLSDKQIEDILYTSDTNFTGAAAEVVNGALLDRNGRLSLSNLFSLLGKTFARSRVNYLRSKLFRMNSNNFVNMAAYVAAMRTVIVELALEIKTENERIGYDVHAELNATEQGKALLNGIPINFKIKVLDKLQDQGKPINIDNIAEEIQKIGSLQDQLHSITRNKAEKDQINAVFGNVNLEVGDQNKRYQRDFGGTQRGYRNSFYNGKNNQNGGYIKQYNNYNNNNNNDGKYRIQKQYHVKTFKHANGGVQPNKGNNKFGYKGNAKGTKNVGICFAFRNTGKCKYGKRCRFRHEQFVNQIQYDYEEQYFENENNYDIDQVNDTAINTDYNENDFDEQCPQQPKYYN